MFQYDNPFFSAIMKVWNCILASALWLVSSLPIFTLGAATSALYYTVNKVVCHERDTVWSAFWHSFKENFKFSTVILLIYTGMIAAVGGLTYGAVVWLKGTPLLGFVTSFLLVMMNALLVIELFTLAYTSRFPFSLKNTLRNGLLITFINMQWGFALWLVLVIAAVMSWLFPVVTFAMPAFIAWAASMFIEKVFRKYMSKEDIETENNLNY